MCDVCETDRLYKVITARVERGIMALNALWGGPIWANHIDLRTFNIREPERCVFGQLYGSYHAGLERFGWTPEKGEMRGFDAECGREWGLWGQYDVMQKVWSDKIRELQTT